MKLNTLAGAFKLFLIQYFTSNEYIFVFFFLNELYYAQIYSNQLQIKNCTKL